MRRRRSGYRPEGVFRVLAIIAGLARPISKRWRWSRYWSGGVFRKMAIIAAIIGIIAAMAGLIIAVFDIAGVVESAERVSFTLPWGLYVGLSSAGGVLLVIGVLLFVHRRRFVSRAASAIGVVTDLKTTQVQTTMKSYYPVVRFQTHHGRMVEFESDTGVPEESSYPLGGQVEVLYDPLNPEKAHIKTFYMLWFGPLLASGIGAVFLVFAIAFLGMFTLIRYT